MRRRHRVLVSAAVVAMSVSLVVLLVDFGTASEGPITAVLETVGGSLSRLESRAAQRLRGTGRAGELESLAPLRASVDSLRRAPRLLLGAYDSGLPATLDGVIALEQALGTTLPLIHVYAAWGDRPDQRFPRRMVDAIHLLGSIPVITWEPWLTDFEAQLHPELPLRDDRDRGGLAAIAGGAYDFYVDEWAREAARFGSPLVLRFAHEMNDPYRYPWGPHNNQVGDFIAAWRYLVERFRAVGADNVVWVWSPHVAYAGYEAYYPGAEFVDWVATGALNYGAVATWSQWWSFEEIFGKHYDVLAAYGKPIMVAEFGSLAVGGDRAEWFREALAAFPQRFADVRALLFFHVQADRTLTYQPLEWALLKDSASVAAIRTEIAGWEAN
jgi:hypothetical protein